MKKLMFVIISSFLIFTFAYKKVNRNIPDKFEIKEYFDDDIINYENCQIKVRKLEVFDSDYFSILPVEFKFKNNNNYEFDSLLFLNNLIFRNGFDSSDIQNIHFPEEELLSSSDNIDSEFSYKPTDFVIEPGTEKKFVLFYPIDKKSFLKYPSFIRLSNDMVKEKYEQMFKDGIIYYEIINLCGEKNEFLQN